MATTYKAPGVYVEEVASGSAPIVGVGTSTAGFIGVVQKWREEKIREEQNLVENMTNEDMLLVNNEEGEEQNLVENMTNEDMLLEINFIEANKRVKEFRLCSILLSLD